MIEPQYENLLFSLVVRGGGAAVSLAFLYWLVTRFLRPDPLKINDVKYERLRRIVRVTFVSIFLFTLWTSFQSSSPKVTLDHQIDTVEQQEPYFGEGAKDEVKNIDPNQVTDEERVRFNRRLIEENAIENQKPSN